MGPSSTEEKGYVKPAEAPVHFFKKPESLLTKHIHSVEAMPNESSESATAAGVALPCSIEEKSRVKSEEWLLWNELMKKPDLDVLLANYAVTTQLMSATKTCPPSVEMASTGGWGPPPLMATDQLMTTSTEATSDDRPVSPPGDSNAISPKRMFHFCGDCPGCKQIEDCGECSFCKDNTKFSGPNKLKQKCSLRMCKNNPSVEATSDDRPGSPPSDSKAVSPKRNSPKRHSPKQNSPEQNSFERNSPQQNSPERNSPEQNSPKQNSPKQNSPKQNSPKRIFHFCGDCPGCKQIEDCGECRFCKDKTKFGGPNKLRQKCSLRTCKNRSNTRRRTKTKPVAATKAEVSPPADTKITEEKCAGDVAIASRAASKVATKVPTISAAANNGLARRESCQPLTPTEPAKWERKEKQQKEEATLNSLPAKQVLAFSTAAKSGLTNQEGITSAMEQRYAGYAWKPCEICGRLFMRLPLLMAHIKKYHGSLTDKERAQFGPWMAELDRIISAESERRRKDAEVTLPTPKRRRKSSKQKMPESQI